VKDELDARVFELRDREAASAAAHAGTAEVV
jgi:hypothetical protein